MQALMQVSGALVCLKFVEETDFPEMRQDKQRRLRLKVPLESVHQAIIHLFSLLVESPRTNPARSYSTQLIDLFTLWHEQF